MKIIVCDTGPILHLSEIKSISLILNMGEIFLPRAVHLELKHYKIDLSSKFKIISLNESDEQEAKKITQGGKIHRGEAEAIILVKRILADYLLTDDTTARLYAELNNINVHGSLGIVLWNLVNKKIRKDEAKDIIDKLKRSSLWLSDKVYERVLAILNEMH